MIGSIIISILIFVSRVFLVFYFLRWFFLAYSYLKSREELYYLTYSPSSTIWSWFVPVLNLFMPFLIMREIDESFQVLLREEKNKLHPTCLLVVDALPSLWYSRLIPDFSFVLNSIPPIGHHPGEWWKYLTYNDH